MGLIAARAPGERGIRHYISEWAYLGGGVVRAECGLWSSTWQITPERRAEDCRRCVDALRDPVRGARDVGRQRMSVYWKATRPDGTDFHTGQIDYAGAVGSVLDPGMTGEGSMPGPGWLHLATVPTACVGMLWPCRLFEVQPVGLVITSSGHPHKVGCTAVGVLREVPAHLALGPQGREVAALIERARGMTAARAAARDAARDAARAAARDAAWDAARDAAGVAAWDAAGDAAGVAAWDAAGDAALALVVRDLIPASAYRTLVGPWASVMGWPHPNDDETLGDNA